MGNVIEKRTSLIASFLAVLLAVVVWQFLALNNNPQLIPSPAKVASGMLELAESGLLWESILISLQRVFKGWLLGSAIAIPLGLLAGTSMLARGALDPFIHFFRFVPALALTSLFILWFGIGNLSCPCHNSRRGFVDQPRQNPRGQNPRRESV
jgi:NitT/TauT family transport system permease protein